MKILGISALYHDSAAALLIDGKIDSAAQEERFTRVKHDSSFPEHAIKFCLKNAGQCLTDIDLIVFYEKPFIKFERLLETYLSFAPKGFSSFREAIPVWIKQKLFQKYNMIKELRYIDPNWDSENKLMFAEHHLSHAASAFYPSPFEEAVVLTMDGVGEWATTSVAIGKGNKLEIIKEIRFPHSIGLLYSAFTYYTGFKVNSGEYKLMGLAPYGNPIYANLIREHLIDIKSDGSFKLNISYFDYCTGLEMTNEKFNKLFGALPRKPDEDLTQFHMDIAASIQLVVEDLIVKITQNLAEETNCKNICLAGGVALNCVANGKILRDGAFQRVWVQPASGDAGGALGASMIAHYWYFDSARTCKKSGDSMSGSFLGPSFSKDETKKRLEAIGARFHVLKEDKLIETCTEALIKGKAIGWHQGRMEFGPRALGSRSILGDARSPKMQSLLNLKIKYRESFRPFAPSVLREEVSKWFEIDYDSPYMLIVANVVENKRRKMNEKERGLFGISKLNVPRSDIPAVTHIDYSSRIQTVHSETNPIYYKLIKSFFEKTGCPILVNTSFNVRGEPIVCTPEDAFHCFMGTEIDILAIGNCVSFKSEQDPSLENNYSSEFELD